MGTQRWWQRTAATACATGLALGMVLAGAGAANAAVDQNAAQNNEPDYNPTIGGMKATQVYSFTFPGVHQQPALTVHGASNADGAIVDTWGRYNGVNYAWANIHSPNQLWEFIPETHNTTGSLVGFGYLRNRQSGKCLERNASDGKIDQWTCVPGAPNELWSAAWNGMLMLYSTGQLLGITDTPGCAGNTVDGNGESLTLWNEPNACTNITYQKENYRFATAPVSVGGGVVTSDNAQYKCMNGYHFAFPSGQIASTDLGDALTVRAFIDDTISDMKDDGGVLSRDDLALRTQGAFAAFSSPQLDGPMDSAHAQGPIQVEYYHVTAPLWQTGQVYLTCLPG